jgi:peptidoglycan/LPS O-acetylase OafA/YrhL
MTTPQPTRNRRLDVLRCLAVVLVMLHHWGISSFFARAGWVGVDLFFVLSGFLISGLLFSEYQRRGSIGFKRFFIRRGLKIYPAFYLFLLITAIVPYGVRHVPSLNPSHFPLATPDRYLHEIFFVQNYCQGVWDHSWSLAVEEHFYIFLPVLLLVLAKFAENRDDPFRILPAVWLAIATSGVAFRALSVYTGTPNFHMAYEASHERMDSLFFGVLLGYLHHFHPALLENLMRPNRNRLAIALVSGALLSSAYWFSRDDKFFATWGYSFVYLGFGGVLLLSLHVRGILPSGHVQFATRVGKALAFVGMYSYSIYLWHAPCGAWLPGLMRRLVHFPTGEYGRFAVYFVGSLVVGILMSRLIEYPVLRLRDRHFPTPQIARTPSDAALDVAPALSADAMPSA